ncbi:MAG: hypothetical protein WC236_02040 [Gallionellaceae bacterium]
MGQALLLIGGGALLFLAATDRLQISPDLNASNQWLATWRKPAKFLGPILFVMGIFRLVDVLFGYF